WRNRTYAILTDRLAPPRSQKYEIAERGKRPQRAHQARQAVEVEEVALLPELERGGKVGIRRGEIDEHRGHHDEHRGERKARDARQRHQHEGGKDAGPEAESRAGREPD